MKKRISILAKKIPIEWFLIIGWALFVMFLIWRAGLSFVLAASAFKKLFHLFYLFGGDFFLLCIGFIDLYLITRFIHILVNALFERKLSSVFDAGRHIGKMILEYLFLILPLSLFLFDSAFMVGILDNYTSADRIFGVSNFLFGLDRAVFGVYPMVWLNRVVGGTNVVADIAITAYEFLTPLVAVFLLYVILRRPSVARKFLLFFFICQVLAAPLWFFVPAVSPYAFYTGKVPRDAISAPVAVGLSAFHPSGRLAVEFQAAKERNATAGDNFFDLTNLPSMHAAWGLGLVYFGAAVFGAAAGYILGAWYIFEIIGAVYTGEHYGVDIIVGIGIALIAFWLVEKILAFEKRRYTGRASFALLHMMHEDSERVKEFCLEFWRLLRRAFS